MYKYKNINIYSNGSGHLEDEVTFHIICSLSICAKTKHPHKQKLENIGYTQDLTFPLRDNLFSHFRVQKRRK